MIGTGINKGAGRVLCLHDKIVQDDVGALHNDDIEP